MVGGMHCNGNLTIFKVVLSERVNFFLNPSCTVCLWGLPEIRYKYVLNVTLTIWFDESYKE